MSANHSFRAVLDIFEKLCAIPHGSGNTRAISDFCADFARSRGLAVSQDGADNLIIRLPAAPGYEDHPTVILQGHLDMVCEKEADSPIDFSRDGLTLRREGDFLFAEKTTLGGDDGIAVAMGLALADSDLPHPPMEIVLTSDEEIGMLGAAAMDMSSLTGRILLNIDSEEEGVLTVACAGGERVDLRLPLSRSAAEGSAFTVTLGGLQGGHSGTEIGNGRENACARLAQLLHSLLDKTDFRLSRLAGGSKDNAIPRECTARIITMEPEAFLTAVRRAGDDLLSLIRAREPEAFMHITPATAEDALSPEDTRRALSLLSGLPCGVQRMVPGLADQVQTSLNLGILSLTEELRASYLVRSSVNGERDALTALLSDAVRAAGGTAATSGRYPAWEYRPESHLREVLSGVWQEMTGSAPAVLSIHAGLECGVFSGKLPGLDCVSFGPDIHDIHTTRERLSLSSAERCWKLLCETLARL